MSWLHFEQILLYRSMAEEEVAVVREKVAACAKMTVMTVKVGVVRFCKPNFNL